MWACPTEQHRRRCQADASGRAADGTRGGVGRAAAEQTRQAGVLAEPAHEPAHLVELGLGQG